MKYAYLTIALLIAGIFLAACSGDPAAGTGGNPAAVIGDPMSDAYATIAVAQTGTSVAAASFATGTAVAAQATAEVYAATAGAGTAVAEATAVQATVESADMTRLAVIATATEAMRLSLADAERVAIELQARQDAAAAAEQINQQIVADNQRRLAAEAARQEQDARLAYVRGTLLNVFLAAMGVGVIILVVAVALDRMHRIRRREQALMILRSQAPAISGPEAPKLPAGNGKLTISGPTNGNGTNGHQLSMLSPGQRTPLLQQDAAALTGRVANWDEFARWRQPDKVVIGVGVNGPVVFDLSLVPHIFAAGATRKGKSTLLRVILAYIATSGYNVVVLNERSSDFAGLSTLPNVMNLRGFTDTQRLRLAQEAMQAAVSEMNRRDEVLHAAGVPTWRDYLRHHPFESPLMFVFVDEFLELTTGNRSARNDLMAAALTLSSQAGKFGIGIGLNATDPTQRALGDAGFGVIQNCARICLGVNTTYASMSVLGDQSAFGLPPGQFVAIDHNGQRHAGIGFNPSPTQLTSYVRSRPPEVVKPFPVALAAVNRTALDEEQGDPEQGSDPHLSQVIEDARLIGTLSGSRSIGRALDSRSAICEYLYEEGHVGWGRTGQNVKRAELALIYLAERGDEWARDILDRSRSSAIEPEDSVRVRGLATADLAIGD